MRTLLLVGGGQTHALYLLNARRFLPEDVRVLLVAPERFAPYSRMLPGLIAGHYRFRDCHIDLGQLCRATETELVFGRVTGLDLGNRRAQLDDGTELPFDLLSLNSGLEPDQTLPGVAEHALNIKPISRFLPLWQETLDQLHGRERNDPANLGVVGGSPAALEMALAIQYRLKQDDRLKAPVEVHLIHSGGSLLPDFPVAAQLRSAQMLQQRQVRVHPLFEVARLDAENVYTDRQQHLPMNHVVWCLRGAASEWAARSGLSVSDWGLIQVNQHLQSVSHPFVFAAGDIATRSNDSRPLDASFTLHYASVLATNLSRALNEEPLGSIKPKGHALSIIACGDEQALARRNQWVWTSRWAWRWKRWADRRFMAQFPRA